MTAKPNIFGGKGRIVTEILGRNKYTNYNQGLNEAIANSLDARSTRISVTVSTDFIEVKDDGIGMSEKDLRERYFVLGEENPDPTTRALFGIGVCANAALGDTLIVETKAKGRKKGIRAVVDFDKVEQHMMGNYKPEVWEEMDFSSKEFSTIIRVERLRWRDVSSKDVAKFLAQKHWPMLLDRAIDIKIYVNGEEISVSEPEDVERYEFSSAKGFKIGEKVVPSQPDLQCGHVEGVFYLDESGFADPSIDVYVKNQRIDSYSGDRVDWLGIKDLRSPQGFKSRLKGIIKVAAESEADYDRKTPLQRKPVLILKSDRSAFFEDTYAFKSLVAYLNEKSKGKVLNLPSGGILRLVNSAWYKRRGRDISSTQATIDRYRSELQETLEKVFEDEKLRAVAGEDELEKRTRKEPSKEIISKLENLMFQCPKCENVFKVKIKVYKRWEKANSENKRKLREKHWICSACGYLLDPAKNKYRRGPLRGTELIKIELEEGTITHILADALGKTGPRSLYIPEESTVKVNAEHAILVYTIKTSDEAFKCYLLDSIIYAIALYRSREANVELQYIYDDLSSRVSRVINVDEYEEALERLKVKTR